MATIEQAIEGARNGDLTPVKEYLESHQEFNPELKIKVESLLGHAVNRNHYDIVEYLVKEGVSKRPPLNNSLVYLAFERGYYKIWRLLTLNCNK